MIGVGEWKPRIELYFLFADVKYSEELLELLLAAIRRGDLDARI